MFCSYLRSSDLENENGDLLQTDDLLGAMSENVIETVYDDMKSIRHVYHDHCKLCSISVMYIAEILLITEVKVCIVFSRTDWS